MKIFKSIGIIILTLLSFVFIFILGCSLIFKNVVQRGVVGSVIKSVVQEEFASNKKLEDTDKENIKRINNELESKDIEILVDKLLDEYESSYENSNYDVKEETVNYIIDLCVKYKDVISEISGETITEEKIRSVETKNGITQAFNEVFEENERDDREEVKIVLSCYYVFISSTFRLIMLLLALGCFALIALLKKSYYKWMKNASIVLIISGALFALLYLICNTYLISLSSHTTNSIEIFFNPTFISKLAIIELIIGALLIVVTAVINSKKESNN